MLGGPVHRPYRAIPLVLLSGILLISVSLNVIYLLRLRHTTAYLSLHDSPLASELPISVSAVTLKFLFGKHYDITKDEEWATLVPENHGRVRLGSAQQEFDVALYSDLQCLDTIRIAFVKMRDGSSVRSPEAERCLGIIRQAILCTADITLEPATLVCQDSEVECTRAEATGDNVDHRCRNWVQVREFVEQNQAGWDVQVPA
ncbi:hypothetical protein BDZ94DRAFT_1263860 [Collybia nuda]|uniref:Uncharacterized protein n=1 Tax=Collybia nuda TaxID=64659 RepID=A0A9P5Y2Z9_9AGAR|nr:hypothetical protein BDZ94DRAFT_1263860 [Collybia nuda]